LTVLQLSDSKFSVFLANFIATLKKVDVVSFTSLLTHSEGELVLPRIVNKFIISAGTWGCGEPLSPEILAETVVNLAVCLAFPLKTLENVLKPNARLSQKAIALSALDTYFRPE